MTSKRTFFPRAQVLAYLAENGPTDTLTLFEATEHAMSVASFQQSMYAISSLDFIDKVAGCGLTAVWCAAAPGLAALAGPQPPAEPHLYPRYCLEQVPPPRQHDGRTQPWAPPAMACTRPGADEFLRVPSLSAGVRKAHQPGYIAALASGKNHPTPSAPA